MKNRGRISNADTDPITGALSSRCGICYKSKSIFMLDFCMVEEYKFYLCKEKYCGDRALFKCLPTLHDKPLEVSTDGLFLKE